MNAPDTDNPLLTRYAIDDLPQDQRSEAHDWIESHPSLQSEIAEIQHLADTLRATAPLHDLHLTSSQRRRVLQPPLRKPLPASPKLTRSQAQGSSSFLAPLLRIAALLALSFTAYWLGRESTLEPQPSLTLAPAPETPAKPSAPTPSHRIPADLPPAPQPAGSPIVAANPPASEKPGTPAAPHPKPAAESAVTAPTDTPKGSSKTPSFGLVTTKADAPFINASRDANDQWVLYPRRLRQPIATPTGTLDAKPVDPSLPAPKAAAAPRKKPDLFIHSWNTEVAACPWDPQLRLLRVNLQFPADQEAVQIGDSDYPLEVVFDPNNVRQFRRLGTRHVPSKELRSAGTQVVWYEFRPNGSPASAHEVGKHVATVRLPSARFTTQTVGPFDASRLQVLDRGQDWRTAREDFRFETAMLGLGLLLDGGLPGRKLNYQLLLEVAETSQRNDAEGTRARLVQNLRQLASWTGRQ
jgi:hypothetical protein